METTYSYDSFKGNAPDPSGGADPFSALTVVYYFTQPTKIIHVWCVDNDLLIRFSFTSDPLKWKEGIQLKDAPQSQDFYHSAQAFQVVNAVTGATAWYQVVGMW